MSLKKEVYDKLDAERAHLKVRLREAKGMMKSAVITIKQTNKSLEAIEKQLEFLDQLPEDDLGRWMP